MEADQKLDLHWGVSTQGGSTWGFNTRCLYMGDQNLVDLHVGSTKGGSTWGFNTMWLCMGVNTRLLYMGVQRLVGLLHGGFNKMLLYMGVQNKVANMGVQHKVDLHGDSTQSGSTCGSTQGRSTRGFNDNVIANYYQFGRLLNETIMAHS